MGMCLSSYSQPKRKRDKVVIDGAAINEDIDPSTVEVNSGSHMDSKDKQPMEYEKEFQKQNKDLMPANLVGSSSNQCSEYDSHLYEGIKLDGEDPNILNDDNYEDDAEHVCDIVDSNIDNQFYSASESDDPPSGVEATMSSSQNLAPMESNRDKQVQDVRKVVVKIFKQFDMVEDYSDHYFTQPNSVKKFGAMKKPSKSWIKRIQYEWKVMEKDLPDKIFVRAYEERLDLLRAVIVGPAGTPYHDGLFFFDILFPSAYPYAPPLVHYQSGGLRLNPNLYCCGKVCLSLLGTWSGKGCETWNSKKSTVLQVLVSIQGLVLNEKPYFNEPGFEKSAYTRTGEVHSLAYNKETFLLSCKTMVHSLRRPPKNFEDFVTEHFREKGYIILRACEAYINGAQVGSTIESQKDEDAKKKETRTHDVNVARMIKQSKFETSLKFLYEELLVEFTGKGADCR